VEELKKKNLQTSIELNDKLISESKNSSVWNDKTLTDLQSIQERIEKFLTDLRHDTPTGKRYYLSFFLSQFLYLYIKFKCSFNISFQVQHRQEKNINIHGILLQLRHTNELFRDSEMQEITSTILTMK